MSKRNAVMAYFKCFNQIKKHSYLHSKKTISCYFLLINQTLIIKTQQNKHLTKTIVNSHIIIVYYTIKI